MDVSELDQEVSATIAAAWSANTLATRNSQWSKYFAFCADVELTPLPANVHTVARFLVFLGRTCKFSTVNNYLSALISLHKFYGLPCDFRDTFLISMILKGLKSTLGEEVKQMKPLTVDQLMDIHKQVVESELDNIYWAIMMLSFRSLLRKSNLVPDSRSVCDHVLRRKDIEVHEWGVMLKVRSSKTLQHKEYVLQIPIYYVDNPRFCAASMVQAHISAFPANEDSPLFVKQVNGKLQPVLYRELLSFIKHSVTRVGLDSECYGAHSLRRSGCAFLHAQGIPLIDIMSMGDWKSLAVLDYLVTPLDRKMNIQRALCAAPAFQL